MKTMRRIFLASFFFFCLVPMARPVSVKGPCLEIDPPEWNFGEVDKGAKLQHTFFLKNTGNKKLIISFIRPGCGCTTVEFSTGTIKPGKSRALTAVFNSRGYRGAVSKDIAIESNDPQSSVKRISLSCFVKPPAGEFDMTMELDHDYPPSTMRGDTKTIFLKNRNMDGIYVNSVKSRSPRYEVGFSSGYLNSEKYLPVNLKLNPEIQKSTATDYLIMEIAVPIPDN